MKIFNRDFVFPILIHSSNNSDFLGSKIFEFQVFKDDEIFGVLNYEAYNIVIIINNKKYQWRIVWRFGVTKYWWKESKRRRKGELKYK